MGRAGAGGGGGRSFSSGGHSSSRSSGGHSIGGGGSSHRAGSGSSFSRPSSSSSYRPSGGSSYSRPPSRPHSPPPPPPPRRHYGGGYGYSRGPTTVYVDNSGSGFFWRKLVSKLIVLFVLLAIVFAFVSFSSSGNQPVNTSNREKLDTGIAFENSCVVDELGWVENLSATERGLRSFYDETGVQPFFYFKAYDPALTTEQQKTEYAEVWYDENIDNESTFLVVYFGEKNEDDVGYFSYVCGKQAGAVMDAEAIEIFWNYLDKNWVSNKTTQAVLVDTFTSTGNRIMSRSTTGMDVAKTGLVLCIVIAAGLLIIRIMVLRRKHKAEEAAETARILEADINTEGMGATDDLLNKYK